MLLLSPVVLCMRYLSFVDACTAYDYTGVCLGLVSSLNLFGALNS